MLAGMNSNRIQDGKEAVMSLWTDLLSLHGYPIPHNDDAEVRPPLPPAAVRAEAERLRELIGCPSAGARQPEPPRGPLLGVRGLA